MMSDEEISAALKEVKTIAVVGLSSKPNRASFGVARFLQRQGYRIIPVNPQETEVLGEKAYPSLSEVPEHVDLADIFRRSEEVEALVDEAAGKGIRYFWMQENVENQAAAEKAERLGMGVVMNRCILKELARLTGR